MTELKIVQRLSVVETELKNMQKEIDQLRVNFQECIREVTASLKKLDGSLDALVLKVNTSGKLNGRDKAMVYAALITGIVSIVIAVVR